MKIIPTNRIFWIKLSWKLQVIAHTIIIAVFIMSVAAGLAYTALTYLDTKQQLLECQKHQLSSPAEKTNWLHRLNRNQDYRIDKF